MWWLLQLSQLATLVAAAAAIRLSWLAKAIGPFESTDWRSGSPMERYPALHRSVARSSTWIRCLLQSVIDFRQPRNTNAGRIADAGLALSQILPRTFGNVRKREMLMRHFMHERDVGALFLVSLG
jgi:hypothetical protein